jgi:hypothetical protein
MPCKTGTFRKIARRRLRLDRYRQSEHTETTPRRLEASVSCSNLPMNLRTIRLLCLAVLLTLGLALTLSDASAAEPGSAKLNVRWEVVGPRYITAPYGNNHEIGRINAFAMNPANQDVMYAGGGFRTFGPASSAGIYKSTNGGRNWVPSSAGLADTWVNDLWLHPTDASILLATTGFNGIYRSVDAGASWRNVMQTSAVNLVQADRELYAAVAEGIATSSDWGQTWRLVQATPTSRVKMVAYGAGTVWAGLFDGTVLRKPPGAAGFTSVGSIQPNPSRIDILRWLAADPRNPLRAIQFILPLVDGRRTFDSDPLSFETIDGGTSWRPFGDGEGGWHAMAFDPLDDQMIYLGTGGSVRLSRDKGATWTDLGWRLDTYALFTFPGYKGLVVAAGDQGVFRSADSGSTWQQLGGDLSVNLVDGLSVKGNYLLLTMQDFQAQISNDDGRTWKRAGISEWGKSSINPGNSRYQYLVNNTDGLKTSSDFGATWRAPMTSPVAASDLRIGTLVDNLPAVQEFAPPTIGFNGNVSWGVSDKTFAADPTSPNIVYLAASDGVYRSTDWGLSFARQNWPITEPHFVLVGIDGRIYVGTRPQSGTSEIYSSSDRGGSWSKASMAPTLAQDEGNHIMSMTVDPSDPNSVFAVLSRPVGSGSKPTGGDGVVMRSTDGGRTFAPDVLTGIGDWSQAEKKYLSAGSPTRPFSWSIEAAPTAPLSGHVALASLRGAYLRAPGRQWFDISGDVQAQWFTQTVWDSGYLYASTWGRGVVRVPMSTLSDLLRDFPVIASPPASQQRLAGGETTLSVRASGAAPLTYQWQKDGIAIPGATGASFTLAKLQPSDAAEYSVAVTNAAGTQVSTTAKLSVGFSRLTNLSVLAPIGGAGDAFTVGYVVGGRGTSGSKNVVLRAVGPSLSPLGVSGVLADPKLERFAGSTKTGENDNWGGSSSLAAAMSSVGAFALSGTTSRDAAASVSLSAGDQSMRISGVGTATGLVLAEVYDATPAATFTASSPRLVNLSLLKDVAGGITAGFVVAGEGEKRVLVRAVGPALSAFGLSGFAEDPKLTLYAGERPIAANDNWGGGADLVSAFSEAGAFVLNPGSRDAALLASLSAGNYTVRVETAGGATGTVLIEVYELPW